jgi:hypothetical protein
MWVKRMVLLAGAALAMAAFAAPGAAQAHCLTENEECIEAGKGVTITSTNLTMPSGLGVHTCAKTTFHYTVETNTDEHLALDPVNVGGVATTNSTTENCVLHTGGSMGATHPVDMSQAGTDTVTSNTWGTGEAQTRFTRKVTFTGGGSITCTYSGSVHIQFSNGASSVILGPSTLNGGLCGNGTVEGSGTLETPDGTPLEADIETT